MGIRKSRDFMGILSGFYRDCIPVFLTRIFHKLGGVSWGGPMYIMVLGFKVVKIVDVSPTP